MTGSNPSGQAATGTETVSHPQSVGRGKALLLNVAGWLLILLGAAAILGYRIATGTGDLRLGWVGDVISSVLGALLGVGGFMLVSRARRSRVPRARDVLAGDTRPPILYLRSFGHDEGEEKGAFLEAHEPVGVLMGRAISHEEEMSELLGQYGPVVAIGRPGEPLPKLGAARMYVGDEAWQQTVLDLMQRSRLVLWVAGFSKGLQWELQNLVEQVGPRRLLIVLPTVDRGFYERFAKWASPPIPKPLPDVVPARCRYLMFDDDWSARPLQLKLSSRGGVGTIARTITPFLLGNQLPVPRVKLIARGRLIAWLAILVGILIAMAILLSL